MSDRKEDTTAMRTGGPAISPLAMALRTRLPARCRAT